MKRRHYVILLVILISAAIFEYFSFTGHDILSIGSGGSPEISVNPNEISEGNIPVDQPPAGGGGTTGGGGGGGVYVPAPTIEVFPAGFDVNLAVNTNIQKTITVKNLKSTQVNVSVSQSNLDNKVLLETKTLTLNANESKNFNVIFVALNDTGIFTGKINVGGIEIPVSLNIRTKLLLFDSNIIVLNKGYMVAQGNPLNTQVTLIPLGDESTRLDVTLNYVIKDYGNKVYLTKSETVLVDKTINFKRDFDTSSLPVGQYIVGLELIYPNGVATSSAHFEVTQGFKFPLSKIAYYIVVAIMINVILIIVVLISRAYKEREETTNLENLNNV